MHPDAAKWLEDIRLSSRFITDKKDGKTFQDYTADDLLRPAVERHFEIIGEALNRLRRLDPSTAEMIPDASQIIAFRNVLIHGYDAINDIRVWGAIKGSLPELLTVVEQIIAKAAGL